MRWLLLITDSPVLTFQAQRTQIHDCGNRWTLLQTVWIPTGPPRSRHSQSQTEFSLGHRRGSICWWEWVGDDQRRSGKSSHDRQLWSTWKNQGGKLWCTQVANQPTRMSRGWSAALPAELSWLTVLKYLEESRGKVMVPTSRQLANEDELEIILAEFSWLKTLKYLKNQRVSRMVFERKYESLL